MHCENESLTLLRLSANAEHGMQNHWEMDSPRHICRFTKATPAISSQDVNRVGHG